MAGPARPARSRTTRTSHADSVHCIASSLRQRRTAYCRWYFTSNEVSKQNLPAAINALEDVRCLAGMHPPAPREAQAYQAYRPSLEYPGGKTLLARSPPNGFWRVDCVAGATVLVDLDATACGFQLRKCVPLASAVRTKLSAASVAAALSVLVRAFNFFSSLSERTWLASTAAREHLSTRTRVSIDLASIP